MILLKFKFDYIVIWLHWTFIISGIKNQNFLIFFVKKQILTDVSHSIILLFYELLTTKFRQQFAQFIILL